MKKEIKEIIIQLVVIITIIFLFIRLIMDLKPNLSLIEIEITSLYAIFILMILIFFHGYIANNSLGKKEESIKIKDKA